MPVWDMSIWVDEMSGDVTRGRSIGKRAVTIRAW